MELVAIRAGFYESRRVRPGESFEFDEKRYKMPKWAKPAAEAAAALRAQKAKEAGAAGDTKPAAAAKAALKRSGAAIIE